MQLTLQQLQTVKAWLLVNATMMSEHQAAGALNSVKDPVYRVYRTFVPMAEIMGNGWDWTLVDNLTIGKARIWEWMEKTYAIDNVGGLNFAKSECRAGINTTWAGNAQMLNVRDSIYAHGYKSASVFEAMFSTGAGTTPPNDGDGSGPGTIAANITAPITAQQVIDAYNS